MPETLRTILSEIGDLPESRGEHAAVLLVRDALSGSDEKLDEFLVSNELWGGIGSIADQAFLFDKPLLKQLENLMIKVGRRQIETEETNVRTNNWVSTLKREPIVALDLEARAAAPRGRSTSKPALSSDELQI